MNKRILLVEDDLAWSSFLSEVIPQVMPTVSLSITSTGEDALSQMAHVAREGNVFDLLLVDVLLEGPLTGLDILRIAHKLNPNLKTIVSSILDADQIAKRIALTNDKYFLFKKPVNTWEYLKTICLALDIKKGVSYENLHKYA